MLVYNPEQPELGLDLEEPKPIEEAPFCMDMGAPEFVSWLEGDIWNRASGDGASAQLRIRPEFRLQEMTRDEVEAAARAGRNFPIRVRATLPGEQELAYSPLAMELLVRPLASERIQIEPRIAPAFMGPYQELLGRIRATGLMDASATAQDEDKGKSGPDPFPEYDEAFAKLRQDPEFTDVLEHGGRVSSLATYKSAFDWYVAEQKNSGVPIYQPDIPSARKRFYKAMKKRAKKLEGK